MATFYQVRSVFTVCCWFGIFCGNSGCVGEGICSCWCGKRRGGDLRVDTVNPLLGTGGLFISNTFEGSLIGAVGGGRGAI